MGCVENPGAATRHQLPNSCRLFREPHLLATNELCHLARRRSGAAGRANGEFASGSCTWRALKASSRAVPSPLVFWSRVQHKRGESARVTPLVVGDDNEKRTPYAVLGRSPARTLTGLPTFRPPPVDWRQSCRADRACRMVDEASSSHVARSRCAGHPSDQACRGCLGSRLRGGGIVADSCGGRRTAQMISPGSTGGGVVIALLVGLPATRAPLLDSTVDPRLVTATWGSR